MNTSPWANPPAPIKEEPGATSFYFEVGTDDDRFDFICTSQEFKDRIKNDLIPGMSVMGMQASEILILSYKEDTDELAVNPEIPTGYYRFYNIGSKTDFKEFLIHPKKVA